MPDPVRLVNRSIALLKRMGMTEVQAAAVVMNVAFITRHVWLDATDADFMWILQVITCAQERAGIPVAPITDYTGDEYGNGSSGGTSRATTAAD